MDTQRDAHLLAPHAARGEVEQQIPSREHVSRDVLSVQMESLEALDTEPGSPAVHMEAAAGIQSFSRNVIPLEPGGPVSPEPPFLEEQTLPASAVQASGESVRRQGGKGAREVPLTMHPSARSFPHVPQVGEEIADLGQEL
eukprot:3193545-Amphidinium_carterae.1